MMQRLRQAALAGLLLLGAGLLGWVGHGHYPIEHWLFWRYAGYWLATLALLSGAFGLGYLTLLRLRQTGGPTLEVLIIAFGVGLLELELLLFVLGALQAYRAGLFFALPLLMLAGSYSALQALARRLWVRARRLRRAAPSLRAHEWAAIAFGFVSLLAVYFLIMTPENVQFDSRWKHLALAEDYAAHGGIRRLGEGWIFGSRPHATTLLFSWAFIAPGTRLFDRMELCAHLEFGVFLITTLIGIPALVRRLVPRADPRLVWVARFLFPGVLLYDSSLTTGADHFGAMYGIPIALLTLRLWRDPNPLSCGVLGALMGAALMVKETTAMLLLPVPALTVTVRYALTLVERARGRIAAWPKGFWLSPVVLIGTLLVCTLPFWGKNLAFYGDPLYPMLNKRLTPDPWTEESAYRLKYAYEAVNVWQPSRDLEGVWKTLKTLVTFSFIPNDWPRFHGKVPVFGSLFTLIVPCLLFLKGTRRMWWLVLWIHVAIFCWYWVHHQDRYLQGILPLMAAVTAGGLVLVFRAGLAPRIAAGALVALQVVWGGDVYFFQTHAMTKSPHKKVLDLLSAGYEKKYEERFRIQPKFQAIAKKLPPGARLLLHEEHSHLGIEAESVVDSMPFQYGISYGSLRTPREVYDLFQKLGVTHIFWEPGDSVGFDTLAGDLMFFDFVNRRVERPESVSNGRVARMPSRPPGGDFNDTVAVFGCGKGRSYPTGLYRMQQVRVPVHGPRSKDFPKSPPEPMPDDWKDGLSTLADFAATEKACFREDGALEAQGYRKVAKRGRPGGTKGQLFDLWIKHANVAPPPSRPAPETESDREELEML